MNRFSSTLVAALAVMLISDPLPARPPEVVLSEPEIPYSVAPQLWEVNLGHHRARIRVAAAAPAVRVHLPWRLQIDGMEQRQLLVHHQASGARVRNVVRISADRMAADFAFEAATAGDYLVYFLPLRPFGSMNDPAGYLPYACDADPNWRQTHRLAAADLPTDAWRQLPAATVLEFQARSELDRFDPMEVIASRAETQAMLANHPEPLLLFPEDRTRPIRMRRDLPLRWAKSGPAKSFSGTALRDEYYAFQIGLHPPTQPAANISVAFSDLRTASTALIPAAALTCFNLGGIDCHGKPFTKQVTVPAGQVQALWIGVDVEKNQPAGIYLGTATIAADGIPPQQVGIRLEVLPERIVQRGDNEPWRHSRLRWLNSTAGTGERIPAPYTPLRVEGETLEVLGRRVTLGADGLPAAITSGGRSVLAAPVRLVIETAEGPLEFRPGPRSWLRQQPSRVAWRGTASHAVGSLSCEAEMEYDGQIRYGLTFTPEADLAVSDIRLELPLRPETAEYILGAGHPGGVRPPQFQWQWQGPFNSFWLGSAAAGLHCKLLGGSYTGPMLNLYHPAPPESWANAGKGGVRVREAAGTVLASAFSGPRKLKAGQPLTFEFSLLPTPVKPLDPAAHFKERYYHCADQWSQDGGGYDPAPTPEALAAGVSVVNLHHASIYNPYINYPFLRTRELSEFTDRMHARQVKVKIYNTIRELTNMVTELWALRSLGDEVIANGGGGGYAWCQEHLLSGYQPAWFQRFGDAPPDAALVTSGESRWFNYYVEGTGWLVRNTGIDGLYLDDVSYDRRILQRVRTVMAEAKPGCLIDLHSNTGFSIGAANHYLEFLPYIDRPWFGESFNYQAMSPDQWLIQVSGIPFGLIGEMLHEGGNPWRGAVFGMTNRLGWQTNGHRCDPTPVWRIWDLFGIADATMCGYWQPDCPVNTNHPELKASVFRKPGRTMIALASWAPAAVEARLKIDWHALGIDPAKAVLHAPGSKGFQRARQWRPDEPITVAPGRGWLIFVDETGPLPGEAEPDPMAGRRVILDERFGRELPGAWRRIVSSQPGTVVTVADEALAIRAGANVSALIERSLPEGVAAAECVVDRGTDPGETWGVGMGLWWPDGRAVRVNLRGPEGRFGVDVTGSPQRFAGRFAPGRVTLRIRVETDCLLVEAMNPDDDWQTLATLPRDGFKGSPTLIRIGKMAGVEGSGDHTTPGAPGTSSIFAVKCYGVPDR